MTSPAIRSAGPLRIPSDAEGSGPDPRGNQKKPAPVSRLGRGLGALIPAAAPRPSPQPPTGAKPVTAEPKPAATSASSTGTSTTPVDDSKSDSTAAASRSTALPSAAAPTSSGTGSPVVSTPEIHAAKSAFAEPLASDPRSTWNVQGDQSVINIPIARIQRNPRQPRERFDDGSLRALADSIRQDGLLQPIVVRASRTITEPNGVQMYELVAGERRLRAFTLLGRSSIPALVHKIDDKTSAVLALIENVQREDLNPMERAHGLQKLMHEFSFSQQDLAARVGLDRSTVANLLRLNDLDAHTASALREGAITTGHAKALLGLSDVAMRKSLVTRAIAEGLSVRELEREVRQASSSASANGVGGRLPSSPRVISAQVADLERRIAAHLGTDVQIKTGRKPGSGAITINFASHSQFEGLMERIGFDLEGSDRPRGR